jgi:hypothetical protein
MYHYSPDVLKAEIEPENIHTRILMPVRTHMVLIIDPPGQHHELSTVE